MEFSILFKWISYRVGAVIAWLERPVTCAGHGSRILFIAAFDEVVGRYEELTKEAEAEGRRIRDAPRQHTGTDVIWQMDGDTTNYLTAKKEDLLDLDLRDTAD